MPNRQPLKVNGDIKVKNKEGKLGESPGSLATELRVHWTQIQAVYITIGGVRVKFRLVTMPPTEKYLGFCRISPSATVVRVRE